MDNRRTLRGRPKGSKKVEVKKNSLLSSNSRRASPSRRSSPSRKSPSRRGSPAKKTSPSRRASLTPRPPSTTSTRSSRQRSAAVITPIPDTPPSPVKQTQEANISPHVKIDKMKTHNLVKESPKPKAIVTAITTTSSVHSSVSISTQKTTDIGSSKNTSGNSEVAKLTDFIRRSVSKTFSMSQREGSQTPSTHPSHISRSVSQSIYDDDDNYTKMEFSDSEEDNFKSANFPAKFSYTPLVEKSSSICRKLEVPKEFGGLLGATILLITFPILSYYLPWCCKKATCEFQKPNLAVLLDLKYIEKVCNGRAVGSYLAFTSGIYVLSAALFGIFVRLPSDRFGSGYHFNAFPIAVIVTILFCLGEYLKYSIGDFILQNYLRFCAFSLLNAVFISIWCYTRSFYDNTKNLQINPYARSGNFIIDFSLGKHVNPKWFGKIDIKQVFYKISLIFTLIVAEINIIKNIQVPLFPENDVETIVGKLIFLIKFFIENVKYDQTSLILSIMLLMYTIDNIVFEHHLASSFELQHEGVGALLLFRYAATPFILNMIPKFTIDQKPIKMPLWLLVLMLIVFLVGLIIKRLSCRIKYKYRINPNQLIFSGIETVHTFQGRRLLLGPFWGRVRQPNYAGEILILVSLLTPLFIRFAWPPLISILLLIVLILHRAKRVSARNSGRYHSSWVRYCSIVKHLVIPNIY